MLIGCLRGGWRDSGRRYFYGKVYTAGQGRHAGDMRVVGYARVSTRGQVQHGTSLGGQRAEIRKWTKAGGHRLVDLCEDGAVSGIKPIAEREGLFCVLEALRTGRAEALVIQNLDRFARELTVQEGTLAAIWRAGGGVFSYESGEVCRDDPDDPMRTAMRQMVGVFAQLERSMVVKRMRQGRARKAEAGGYAVGAPPLGLRAMGGVLVTDQRETATLTRIRDLHASGTSLRGIAATLAAEGHATKRGGKWWPQTVAKVLARDAAALVAVMQARVWR